MFQLYFPSLVFPILNVHQPQFPQLYLAVAQVRIIALS